MKRKIAKILTTLFIPLIFIGCNDKVDDNGKIKVAATINTLGEFTEIIGGDKVDVYTVVKGNMEPHDFDFTPSDQKELSNRKVLFCNGLGLDEWTDQISVDLEKVNTNKNSNVIVTDGEEDPHVWLSTQEAIKQCEIIKDKLVEIDLANKDYYEDNFNKYKAQLENLYNKNVDRFNDLKEKTFVTSHEAFAYLCRDMGLEQRAIKGVTNEDVESTIKDMKQLADFCRAAGINVVFSENSDSQKDAETLAKEINGKVVPIYTLESKVEGKTYLEALQDDYDKIYDELNSISK
ncbi:MAG: ABC transporter substrate-binding protein [Clostridium sp.]|jgi:zinc transport system substrate-binding protein|nr:ABC transporter substrate-binding protein [Clostridium sp.]